MAPTKELRIAWVGPGPDEGGGVASAVTEVLGGLARRGHRIDCFLPGKQRELPPGVAGETNLTFIWGESSWEWNRWYSNTKLAAFASGLVARGIASLRLRRELARRHRDEPYDVIYQYSTIENLAVPPSVVRTVPLVIHPQTHSAGELRFLIAERRLSWRCQPRYIFALVVLIMSFRALVQRIKIRRANLLICVSGVFRDHMVHDYGFPLEATVVVHNPMNLDQFANVDRPIGEPPIILVPTRIAVRKGIDDVVAVARELLERKADVRVRIVGGPSLFSDYTKLLDDLPAENSEYVGRVPHSEIPAEFERADVMLIASRFDPCPLAVLEALAAGVPVVATSEVGSIEDVARSVAAVLEPGDVPGMATAVEAMVDRVKASPTETRSAARAEAERLFAPERICEQISTALEGAVDRGGQRAEAAVLVQQ
jgi:glycosyltransferase involved in cell wall biosynthesis